MFDQARVRVGLHGAARVQRSAGRGRIKPPKTPSRQAAIRSFCYTRAAITVSCPTLLPSPMRTRLRKQ